MDCLDGHWDNREYNVYNSEGYVNGEIHPISHGKISELFLLLLYAALGIKIIVINFLFENDENYFNFDWKIFEIILNY